MTTARGEPSKAVIVVGADAPTFAMPAAAYAAKTGTPVLFTGRTELPAATAAAIRTHGRPRIYVLGDESAVSSHVLGRGKCSITTGSLEIANIGSMSLSRHERRRRRSVSITPPSCVQPCRRG